MVLALILSLVTTIIVIILILLLSSLFISVNKFELFNKKGQPVTEKNKVDQILKNINLETEINVKLAFLNKIPLFSINITKEKILKIIRNDRVKKMTSRYTVNDLKDKNNIDFLKYLKGLKPRLEKFNLSLNLGTEDAVITSFATAIIASGISIFLARAVKNYNPEKLKYVITPVYMNKNIIEIGFNCIFKINLVHIIHVIYLFLKKRRVDKNERTSNRRSYDYSYE